MIKTTVQTCMLGTPLLLAAPPDLHWSNTPTLAIGVGSFAVARLAKRRILVSTHSICNYSCLLGDCWFLICLFLLSFVLQLYLAHTVSDVGMNSSDVSLLATDWAQPSICLPLSAHRG